MISLSSRCSISPCSGTTDHDALGDLPHQSLQLGAGRRRHEPKHRRRIAIAGRADENLRMTEPLGFRLARAIDSRAIPLSSSQPFQNVSNTRA